MCSAGDAANWGEQFNAEAGAWIDEYGRETSGNLELFGAELQQPRTRQEGYVFAVDNPFMEDAASFGTVRNNAFNQLLYQYILYCST